MSSEPVWIGVKQKTVYDCPMPDDGQLIVVAYGAGIEQLDRCIVKDGEYLLASGRKWSGIDAWKILGSWETGKVSKLFDVFVETTDVDSEYDEAYKLYSPKGLDKMGVKRKKIRERIVNDLELVEPVREMIRDNIPVLYCKMNDNYKFFDDSLAIMAKQIESCYIKLAVNDEMKRAATVLVVRLWEISLLSKIDKIKELWDQYDEEFGDEKPFKVE